MPNPSIIILPAIGMLDKRAHLIAPVTAFSLNSLLAVITAVMTQKSGKKCWPMDTQRRLSELDLR
jgi:hypothetical protein